MWWCVCERERERKTERKTDRQTDIEGDSQTERDRETERQRDRETEKKRAKKRAKKREKETWGNKESEVERFGLTSFGKGLGVDGSVNWSQSGALCGADLQKALEGGVYLHTPKSTIAITLSWQREHTLYVSVAQAVARGGCVLTVCTSALFKQ